MASGYESGLRLRYAGWLGLGFALAGSGVLLLLSGSVRGVAGVGDAATVESAIAQANSVVKILGLAAGIGAVLLILAGFFVSGLILEVGLVRRPWATTLSALAIMAILDLPLGIVYLWLAAKLTDTRVAGPFFLGPFFFVIGTVVVGVLVWLWMTWARRGPAVGTAPTAQS